MSKINGFEFVSPDKWRFLNNTEVEQSAHRAREYSERNFYFDNIEYRIEEYLRQWMLTELTKTYGYPENWLWLASSSKRNANIVVKDETNRSLALIAARYFGDSDLEFEKAGHDLQSDLEDIETVRFGLVTDGRRIAFLCKNGDDQIGDYKTIADFPVYNDLKALLEMNQAMNLPATTNKFQKLPAPKRPAKSEVAASNQKLEKQLAALPKLKSSFVNRRQVAAVFGALLLVLLGAWYVTKSEPTANAQPETTAAAPVQPEKDDKMSLRATAPRTSQERSSATTTAATTSVRSRASKSAKPDYSQPETNPDGSVKLNRADISIMRTAVIPNSRNSQMKVAIQPPSAPEEQSSNRKIIRQPFTQAN